MPAFTNLLTNLLLIFPLFTNNSSSLEIITPLASGEVLGVYSNSITNQLETEEFNSPIGEVLGIQSTPNPIQNESPEIFPKTFKGNIKILILGSTQTKLLENGNVLISKLSQYYPKIQFDFINYSTNQSSLDYALAKTNDTFLENGGLQKSVIFQEPDILIIDTFGYDKELLIKTNFETHLQKLNNLSNLVYSYNKSQNIFLSNFTPSSSNFEATFPNDANQQYAMASKNLEIINNLNKQILEKSLPLIDITAPSVEGLTNKNSRFLNPDYTASASGVELTESKIIEYFTNNQIIDKALETQKLF